jgi:hypothetical protein
MPTWSLERTDANAHRMELQFPTGKERHRILLLADLHWDNAHCDLALLRSHLEQAKAGGWPVMVFGDLFCAMQGKWDPRASQDAMRDEHRGGAYLDLLVGTALEWFTPYAANLALISPGNHETSIQKRHEVNLSERLVAGLRLKGSRVELGTYWGFIGLACSRGQQVVQKVLHYHHGYGGGGPISRGLIDHSRTRSDYSADVFVSGHIHRRNADENIITRLSSHGKVNLHQQLFLRCSTYKDESGDGWHVQQGRAARPLGGWWLELQASRTNKNKTLQVDLKAVPT